MKNTSILIIVILLSAMSTTFAEGVNGDGKHSLATLGGTGWVLIQMNHEKSDIEEARVTLAFSDGQVSGKSACNRYSAGVEESNETGGIHIGQSMSTRMACPDNLMKIEQEYLAALSHVVSFSFDSGSLVLQGQDADGTPVRLLFKPVGNVVP